MFFVWEKISLQDLKQCCTIGHPAVVEMLACAVRYGSLSCVAGAAEELNFELNLI